MFNIIFQTILLLIVIYGAIAGYIGFGWIFVFLIFIAYSVFSYKNQNKILDDINREEKEEEED